MGFFKICPVFNISVWLEKSSIVTTFDQLSTKNKVRFEILSIFYVDMYITKHVLAFILCFPERYEFALDVFFTYRFVLAALYSHWNKCCKQFAHIHIDVKFFKEADSGLISSKSWAKIVKKVSFSRYVHFSTFRYFLKHRQFWPLLTNFSEKIRSDSKSSAFFTSTCTKPKRENHNFPGFMGQYFQKKWLQKWRFSGTFLAKSRFWPISINFR